MELDVGPFGLSSFDLAPGRHYRVQVQESIDQGKGLCKYNQHA